MTLHRRIGAAFIASATMSGLVLAGTASAATAAGASPQFDKSVDSAGQVQQLRPTQPLAADGDAHRAAIASGYQVPAEQLQVQRTVRNGAAKTVRMQQVIDGVQVFGAVVTEAQDAEGKMISTQGSVAQNTAGSFPEGPRAEQRAGTAARAGLAARHDTAVSELSTDSVEPTWFDASLFSDDGTSTAVPAYVVEVSGAQSNQGWRSVVDARSGKTLLSYSTVHSALNRAVCDAERQQTRSIRCGTTFDIDRGEGDEPYSVEDVNKVYNFFGETQSFYSDKTGVSDLTSLIGSDYGDGAGTALRGTVRICTSQCPYRNAFWNGEQMAFGEGVTTDDVTGHELTHGVTQETNGLVYRNQPGAINESMSDVFGEFVDITNGDSDDTSRTRWQIGDSSALGVIRDMQDPGAYNQPDKMSSPDYYTGSADNGGVHTNSGVGNKAAYLITDGDRFNGYKVKGIGVDKAAQIYWTAQTLLTPNSDYRDLGRALNSACDQNARSHTARINQGDCHWVGNAVKATEML